MKQIFFLFLFICSTTLFALNLPIKEIARIDSMRDNQISGYGIVVGLPQTGDSRIILAQDVLKELLSFKGIKLDNAILKTKNIAAVIVTAKIPPFSRSGDSLDIWVSSIGDAKSLEGGYLLQTPLSAADGKIYAVAQSSINASDSGKSGGGKNTAYLVNAAIMEKDVVQPLAITSAEGNKTIQLNLFRFNPMTVTNVIDAINKKYPDTATLTDNVSIIVKIPTDQQPIPFLNMLLQIPVKVEVPSKVVLDARSGLIVMGGQVSITNVAVTKKGVNVEVGKKSIVSTSDDKNKKNETLFYLEETATVSQLVEMLNRLGISPREMIDILKAIHLSGALQGELIVI